MSQTFRICSNTGLQHQGHALSRDQLVAAVWPRHYKGGSNIVDTSTTSVTRLTAPHPNCLYGPCAESVTRLGDMRVRSFTRTGWILAGWSPLVLALVIAATMVTTVVVHLRADNEDLDGQLCLAPQ
jgi:hypothetical protein